MSIPFPLGQPFKIPVINQSNLPLGECYTFHIGISLLDFGHAPGCANIAGATRWNTGSIIPQGYSNAY
jgi:hypothetical protein